VYAFFGMIPTKERRGKKSEYTEESKNRVEKVCTSLFFPSNIK